MAKSKRKKSKVGKIVYGAGCGCGLALLIGMIAGGGIGAWMYWNSRPPSRPESQSGAVARELDRTEPDWTFDATVAKWRDAKLDKNGADLTLDVAKALPAGWDRDFDSLSRERMGQALTTSPQMSQAARGFLDRNKATVAKAKQLALYPQARFNIQLQTNPLATKLGHLQEARKVVALLRVIAVRETLDDHPDESVESVRAILNLGRYAKEEPFTISQVVYVAISSVAVDTLEDCFRHQQAKDAADVALASLQTALLEEGDDLRMTHTLRCERAMSFQTLDALRTKKLTLADIGKDENLQVTPEMSRLAQEQADYGQFLLLTKMNEAIEISKLPSHEQHARFLQWEEGVRAKTNEVKASEKKDGAVGLLLLPALAKVHGAHMRRCAYLRTAGTALAVERYRRDTKTWPADLSKLVPKYLARVPLDPYTGRPLSYQFYPEGVAIMSVGTQKRQPPGAFGLLEERGADTILSFRLWNRNLRQAPAGVK
jgi:hypothetical protein